MHRSRTLVYYRIVLTQRVKYAHNISIMRHVDVTIILFK